MDRVVPKTLGATCSRARTPIVGRPPILYAPTAPLQDPFSTFIPIDGGIEAHEVPLPFPTASKPMIRIFALGRKQAYHSLQEVLLSQEK